MTARLEIGPVTRSDARRFVAKHHSHHKSHIGETLAIGGYVSGSLVAVCVMARPVAPALDDGRTWEVTRLCVGPNAPKFAASRLLGAATKAATAIGIRRLVSYTRCDESGTCYKAANWTQAATVKGDSHTHGNRANRWLPGLYEPSTEIVDRIRWEYVR